jgi:hypothetical protein
MPSSASLLLIAGFGAFGLAAASLYVFYNGRAAIERPDAGVKHDAPFYLLVPDTALPDASIDASIDAGEPASEPDAAVLDAAEPAAHAVPHAAIDAPRPTAPRDAGLPRPPRAPVALPKRVDAGPVRSAGTATLTIGANPWGTVLLDGRKIGRTPIEHLSVPAGRHVIEVSFGGEDPPRTQRYTVELADGEAKDLLADFTRP